MYKKFKLKLIFKNPVLIRLTKMIVMEIYVNQLQKYIIIAFYLFILVFNRV